MMDEKVKIRCTKCSQVFRERAQRIRNGFQTNCQHCNRLITFDASSEDKNIRRALMSAKEVRMALEAQAENKTVAQGSVGDRSQF
jgi:predicted  nucleic acid-binding Zn-ribbon protein